MSRMVVEEARVGASLVLVLDTRGEPCPNLWVAHARDAKDRPLSVELERAGRRCRLMFTYLGRHRPVGVVFASEPSYAELRPHLYACLEALLAPDMTVHPGAVYAE